MILAVFSRSVVRSALGYRKNVRLAKALIEQAPDPQKIMPQVLTLQADRGTPSRWLSCWPTLVSRAA